MSHDPIYDAYMRGVIHAAGIIAAVVLGVGIVLLIVVR